MDQSPIWRRLQSCMASMPVPESHAESHAVRNEPGDPMSCILGLTSLVSWIPLMQSEFGTGTQGRVLYQDCRSVPGGSRIT